jgi:putative lipoprotein
VGDAPPDAPPAEEGAAPPAAEADDPLAGGGIQRVTGVILLGQDRQDFQACAGGPEYWVGGPALAGIYELHANLTPGQEPFESIFVDVLAAPGSPPSSGPGAGLAGRLDVLEVRRAAFEGWGCRDVDDDLVVEARGNEPFWLLEVTESAATFSTPEGDRSWRVDGPAPSPEGWRLTGTTDAGGPFTLVLEVGGCVDSMSGAWSHLAARLEMGADVLDGCGFLGVRGEGQ